MKTAPHIIMMLAKTLINKFFSWNSLPPTIVENKVEVLLIGIIKDIMAPGIATAAIYDN